jgi:hypothetical protein
LASFVVPSSKSGFKQRAAAGVAGAQPDDDRAGFGLAHELWEILSRQGRFFGISCCWLEVGRIFPVPPAAGVADPEPTDDRSGGRLPSPHWPPAPDP